MNLFMSVLRRCLFWWESLAILALCLALWWLASHGDWISRGFLPTPEATWASLVQGFSAEPGMDAADLRQASGQTFVRMFVGWGLASLMGVALGALIGMSPVARDWIAPSLEFLRPLPASAVLPLAISLFGLSSGMVLFVVSFGAMWPVLLATVQGLAQVEPRLREVAAGLQLSRLAFAWKIGLPSTLPDILAGMRLSMTVSLIVAVVGEMIASQPGLGQAILLAARSFRASELFAGIVLLGALGFLSNAVLASLEHRLLRWQHP
jgi:ABC-type nitrate/sulfonate/bicarbonate transport system permease component